MNVAAILLFATKILMIRMMARVPPFAHAERTISAESEFIFFCT